LVKGSLQAAIAPAILNLTDVSARASGGWSGAVVAGKAILVVVEAGRVLGFADQYACQGSGYALQGVEVLPGRR
jgi:hypothetical protein